MKISSEQGYVCDSCHIGCRFSILMKVVKVSNQVFPVGELLKNIVRVNFELIAIDRQTIRIVGTDAGIYLPQRKKVKNTTMNLGCIDTAYKGTI